MPLDDTDGLIRRELRRLAELEPSSGRQAQAKATAFRALLRLEGRGGRELTEAEEHLWDPDRREDELVEEDDWHPSRDTGFFERDLCHRSVNAGAGGSPWPQAGPATGAEWPDC